MKGRQADRALPAPALPPPPPPATGPTRTSAGHRNSRRRLAPGSGPAFRPRRIRVSAAVRALAGFGCRRFLERSRGRISVPRLRFRWRGPSAEITGLECLHRMPANSSNESFDTGVTKRGGPDSYLNLPLSAPRRLPTEAPRRLASPCQAFHRTIHKNWPNTYRLERGGPPCKSKGNSQRPTRGFERGRGARGGRREEAVAGNGVGSTSQRRDTTGNQGGLRQRRGGVVGKASGAVGDGGARPPRWVRR